MTASEVPGHRRVLPGFFTLLTHSFRFLVDHSAILYGYVAWLLIPVLVNLGASFFDPAVENAVNILAGVTLFGLSLWATAAITIVVAGIDRPDLLGDLRGTVSEVAWRRAPTLLWIGLLVGLLQIVGFVLLIIPGIIFTVWFAFAETEAILTGTNTLPALAQSRERVRGVFFPVLVRMLLFSILIGLILLAVMGTTMALLGISDVSILFIDPPSGVEALFSMLGILLTPCILVYQLKLYFALRTP